MLERDLEKYFAKEVKARGAFPVKLLPPPAGIPDRMVIAPGGVVLFVELKTSTGKTSKIQDWMHRKMAALGVHVHVLYGKEEIDQWLSEQLM